MLRRIWRWGKKVVITGAVVTSAPFIVPPLLVLSALGFAVSVPFGFAFVGYACTAKILKLLWVGGPRLLSGGSTSYAKQGTSQNFESSNLQQKSLAYSPRELERGIEGEDALKEEEIKSLSDGLEEAEETADEKVAEEGKDEMLDEAGAVDNEIVDDQRRQDTEEKSAQEEWGSMGKEMVEEGNLLPGHSQLQLDSDKTHDVELASSTGTAGCSAPPSSSFEDLTNTAVTPASSAYSSVELEVFLERNSMTTDSADKDVYDEEKLWLQLEALRTIVGYKAALQTSFMEELKALYVFTGVEPLSLFGESADLKDANHKLRYLKSVVGVK